MATYYWNLDIVDFLNIILWVIYILFKNMKEKYILKVYLNFMEMENQKYLLWGFYCIWNQIYLDAHCFDNGNVAKCQNTSRIVFYFLLPRGKNSSLHSQKNISLWSSMLYFYISNQAKIPTSTQLPVFN